MSKMELKFGDADHALAHLQEFIETRRLINQTGDIVYIEALLKVAKISMEHGDDTTAYDASIEALEVFEVNRPRYQNEGHGRLGQEAKETIREILGKSGNNQSLFKRFGAGIGSLADEVG